MATRIPTFAVTVPAQTLESAPFTQALDFTDAPVQRLEIRIPPGPSGLMGFAILHSGTQVIPYQAGSWIITDDERMDWPLERFPTGSAWSLRGYNLDLYPHTVYLRFLLADWQPAELVTLAPLAIPIGDVIPAELAEPELPELAEGVPVDG